MAVRDVPFEVYLREAVLAVVAALPEREGAPLRNGTEWALGHQGEEPPSAQELIQRRMVGNSDQAGIFLRSVAMVRMQIDRNTDREIALAEQRREHRQRRAMERRSQTPIPRSRPDLSQDRGR